MGAARPEGLIVTDGYPSVGNPVRCVRPRAAIRRRHGQRHQPGRAQRPADKGQALPAVRRTPVQRTACAAANAAPLPPAGAAIQASTARLSATPSKTCKTP